MTALLALVVSVSPGLSTAAPDAALIGTLAFPFPLSTYGYSADPADSSLDYAIQGEGSVLVGIPESPAVAAVRGSYAEVQGATAGADGYVYYAVASLELGMLWRHIGASRFGALVSVGPAVLWSGFVLDDVLQKHTVHVGAHLQGALFVDILPYLAAHVLVGFDGFGRPLRRTTFFNEPLSETRVVSVGVGLTLWTP